MALNLGIGITVLGAVAVETIGRSDSDVVAGEFSVDRSGEDQLSVVVGVRVRAGKTDADVARVVPFLLDTRTTDPLESHEFVFMVLSDLLIEDTEGCVVFWIELVINLLKLGNDGAVLSAVGVVESCQNASIVEVLDFEIANVSGTSAEDQKMWRAGVVEQTCFAAEGCGATVGSVAEADYDLVFVMGVSVELLLGVIRHGSVGGTVGA